ncbi:hypothetical protein C8Q74DRAFT_1436480 [Fomes fomentarius]|nr:hypothetical protein C8Q74DRAFT_1436480 [Fomes fomentarius]
MGMMIVIRERVVGSVILLKPNERVGHHVFRYLRTLTAWHIAGMVVVIALRKLLTPQISIYLLTDGSQTFDTNRDSMSKELQQERIIELSGVDPDVVSGWVERSLNVRKVRVHAVAGLMALAYCIWTFRRLALARNAATCATSYGWSFSSLCRRWDSLITHNVFHDIDMPAKTMVTLFLGIWNPGRRLFTFACIPLACSVPCTRSVSGMSETAQSCTCLVPYRPSTTNGECKDSQNSGKVPTLRLAEGNN